MILTWRVVSMPIMVLPRRGGQCGIDWVVNFNANTCVLCVMALLLAAMHGCLKLSRCVTGWNG